jgi:hypothetical protein
VLSLFAKNECLINRLTIAEQSIQDSSMQTLITKNVEVFIG